MPALVSTIVPVYNGTRWLRATVESLLSQTWPHHEVILVDDGSTDGSSELLVQLSEDSRIKVVRQANAGVAAARNTGIGVATGDYLAFCDQDDLWLPSKLERQLPLFSDTVGLVYSGVEFRYPDRSRHAVPSGSPADFDTTLANNGICSCTVVARRELVDRVGAFEGDRALMGVDDWHLWLKLLNVTASAFAPEVLAVHRVHDNNYSSREGAMLSASLACLDALACDPDLADRPMDLDGARVAVYRHYGRNFLHYGQFSEARECLRQSLKLSPLDGGAFARLALLTLLPDTALSALQQFKRSHLTSWAL